MYLLQFLVPESHLEPVKNAIFDTGVGRLGNYARCAWQTLGQGQFMPLSGSEPHLGKPGKIETVTEYKVEIVCTPEKLKEAIAALKQAHPYEVPAYQVMRFEI